MKHHRLGLISIILLLLPGASAQEKKPEVAAQPLRAEFMRVFDDLNSKFVALAEAIPAERYAWRPGEGVRSIREVLTHVAEGNYSFMSMAGVANPFGVETKSIGALADKTKIIEALKQSFDHVRRTYGQMSDADFEKPAKVGRRDTVVREVFFQLITHEPEHLGQLIAYARMVNVVPPWTADRQARAADSKAAPAVSPGKMDAHPPTTAFARGLDPTAIPIAPPAPINEPMPPKPGADYVWVAGQYVPLEKGWTWRPGVWSIPPGAGDIWNPGHYDVQTKRWTAGYWQPGDTSGNSAPPPNPNVK